MIFRPNIALQELLSRGPKATPRRNRESGRVAVSAVISKAEVRKVLAGAMMEEASVMVKVTRAATRVCAHFLRLLQLRGLRGLTSQCRSL